MNSSVRIVIIGAGSFSFGTSCLQDAFFTKELWGSELVLVDVNAHSLGKIEKLAERMNNELKAGYKISHTTDRCEALRGADFIIISVAVDRNKMWKYDFEVPKKYGIQHVLGENGGPGSIFHTMRNIPIILDICNDIERICPNALVLNFTNPESRICLAINKYTRVKAVGLCHQIGEGIKITSKILAKQRDEIDVKAAGLNHFTWIMDIRDKKTGEDLYPLLRERERGFDPEYEKLTRFMFRQFGLFPTAGDGHLGEYLPFASEFMGTEGYDFKSDERNRKNIEKVIDSLIKYESEIKENYSFHGKKNLLSPSGEVAFDIIKGILLNTNELIISANIPNNGCISNLPYDAIVEVPVMVSGNGINGLLMGDMPRGIAALCSSQINVQHLVVDAGVKGDKNLALQAMLTDPNVPSADAALNIFDELMELNSRYLPQFK